LRLLVAALAALLLLALAPSAQAGWSSDPIQLALTEHLIRNPVDHETWCGDCNDGENYMDGSPWTVNPGWVPGYVPPIDTPGFGPAVMGGCLWDVDDTYFYETSGNVMAAGQVLAFDECIWQGPNLRRNGGQNNYGIWRSPSSNLVIRYEYAWAMTDGTTKTASYTVPGPESVSKGIYTYRACVKAPGVVGGVLVAVPGSHDGEGVYQVLTATVTNPAGKVAKTGGFFGSDPRDTYGYCYGQIVDPT
jgi:hypothetical protein